MDLQRLRQAEADFLQAYPGGFADPALQEISRKHRVDKMTELAREVFARPRFNQPNTLMEDLVRVVSRSSMVSMFEKPKFRDAVHDMNSDERQQFVAALRKLMYPTKRATQASGFETLVEILAARKLARWSLMTISLVYLRPDEEVFVKPTTAKKIIEGLSLDLHYRPRPSWEFYAGYRAALMDIKSRVNPSLATSNAALTGFLMMTLESNSGR